VDIRAIVRRVTSETSPVRLVEEDSLRVTVVGVGGAGCNMLSRVEVLTGGALDTLAINVDEQHLRRTAARRKILISAGRRGGTGGRVDVGEAAAYRAISAIRESLEDADVVFVLCGLGGGTGTGASPVVASAAREMGSIVFSIVTMPFSHEGRRVDIALQNLPRLVDASSATVVIENERLMDHVPHLPFTRAFDVINYLVAEMISGLVDTITRPSMINIDLSDLRELLISAGGLASILFAEEDSADPRKIVMEALNNPLISVDFSRARGALIHLSTGSDIPISTVYSIVRAIREQLMENAYITLGARIVPGMEGRVRMLCILSGIPLDLFLAAHRERRERPAEVDLEFVE